MKLTVREMRLDDIQNIVSYFVDADAIFLKGMGADKAKLPDRDVWIQAIEDELKKPYQERELYYIIWLVDNQPIGHSNLNHIDYGNTANMHLHIWGRDMRKSGFGLAFSKQTIPFYFNHFKLKTLLCEPYANNPGPNKILKKLGFDFIRAYETIPGTICFLQTVNRYELTQNKINF